MEGYNLDDFLTANNLDKIIDYNIDNKINKAKKDRHIRGRVGTVTGDVCDFYINNATEAIPNVKINSGQPIFEGDYVYALAINGNLSNMIIETSVHNFEKMFGIKIDNFKLIEGFQNSTDWINV